MQRLEAEKREAEKAGQTKISRTLNLPSALKSITQLNELIQQLNKLKDELDIYCDIQVTINLEDRSTNAEEK